MSIVCAATVGLPPRGVGAWFAIKAEAAARAADKQQAELQRKLAKADRKLGRAARLRKPRNRFALVLIVVAGTAAAARGR